MPLTKAELEAVMDDVKANSRGYLFPSDIRTILESHLAPEVEGWIVWEGVGKCPVQEDAVVEYMMRGGENDFEKAGDLDWHHESATWDIIRYRVKQ